MVHATIGYQKYTTSVKKPNETKRNEITKRNNSRRTPGVGFVVPFYHYYNLLYNPKKKRGIGERAYITSLDRSLSLMFIAVGSHK